MAMASRKIERRLVVIGVDGSPQSVAALHWGARYAAATGAAVRAVVAWHPLRDQRLLPGHRGTGHRGQRGGEAMTIAGAPAQTGEEDT
jgi:nucleotide-binding universal stress UspA family protein